MKILRTKLFSKERRNTKSKVKDLENDLALSNYYDRNQLPRPKDEDEEQRQKRYQAKHALDRAWREAPIPEEGSDSPDDLDYITDRLDEGFRKSKEDREGKLEKSRTKGLAVGSIAGLGSGIAANKLLKIKDPSKRQLSVLGGLALGMAGGALIPDIYTRKKYKGYLKHQYDAMDDVIKYDKSTKAEKKKIRDERYKR